MAFIDFLKIMLPDYHPQKPQSQQQFTFYQYPDDDNTGMFYELTNNGTQANIGTSYDTTRIFIHNEPKILAGTTVQKCLVSWYNHKDKNNTSSKDYKYVLADINMDKFHKDENYHIAIMTMLFSLSNVHNHLTQGLEESPAKPCGNYIGGIRGIHPNYELDFIPSIGEAAHNSPAMKKHREWHQKKQVLKGTNKVIRFDPR